MRISEEGLRFIKKTHEFSETAYKNSANERYWSIGYCHYGRDVYPDLVITEEKADELLRRDIHKFEGRVAKYDIDYRFSQEQFDALVSFCFDVGNIDELTNYGRRTIEEFSRYMPLYCKFCGKIRKDLINIRKLEMERLLRKEATNVS